MNENYLAVSISFTSDKNQHVMSIYCEILLVPFVVCQHQVLFQHRRRYRHHQVYRHQPRLVYQQQLRQGIRESKFSIAMS